jgi:hypothetical protein
VSVEASQVSVRQGVVTAGGQKVSIPSQLLADVRTDPSALHEAGEQTTLVPATMSEGQAVLEPVQVSARSHSPAEARHMVPALPAGCWQVTLEPSH